MPVLPSTPCGAPGCRNVCQGGRYCPNHQRQTQARFDDSRGTSKQRGYDATHRKLRILCFERDEWRCQKCRWEPESVQAFRESGLGAPPTAVILDELRRRFNRNERHLHADHVIPIEVNPALRLDLDNMSTLCNQCHGAKTLRELGGHR